MGSTLIDSSPRATERTGVLLHTDDDAHEALGIVAKLEVLANTVGNTVGFELAMTC